MLLAPIALLIAILTFCFLILVTVILYIVHIRLISVEEKLEALDDDYINEEDLCEMLSETDLVLNALTKCLQRSQDNNNDS